MGHFGQIAQAAIGAAAEKRDIHLGALDGLTGFQMHVNEGLFSGGAVFFRQFAGGGHLFINEDGLAGIDTPGHGRADVCRLIGDHIVIVRPGVGGERLPAGDGGVPIGGFWRVGTSLQVGEGGFVGVDVADARAALDGHIANGHALLLGEGVKGRAAVFVGVTETAIHSEFADDVQNDVLGINAGRKFTLDVDAADFRLVDGHGLGGQNVAHLTGADAEGDGAEGSVGRGVGVATGDGGARLGDALLRSDDVDDALLAAGQVEERDAGLRAVFAQRLDHVIRELVGKRFFTFVGGHNVIDGGERALRIEDL